MAEQQIWLSLATMGGGEMAFIQEAFDTNWVVPLGPNVTGFENDLAGYLGGGQSVVALSSGTAALHLALLLLEVGSGDDVICQSFTFAASANPITYLGATPVFVDSEADTWNMSPEFLEKAILARIARVGKPPKAIIGVDLYGMPAKWDEICSVAARYGIPLIEDAAEALGSSLRGRMCGTHGQFGILSFNGNKIITTSGGGALVCPSADTAKQAVFYATQARDPAPHYQHSKIGFNYRMSNICAGIGRGQMQALDRFVRRRRDIHARYARLMAGIHGITVMQAPGPEYASNYWLTTILMEPARDGNTREDLRLALEAERIETRPLWKPMHLQPVFLDAPFYGDGTSEALFDKGLCLPSGASLTDADIERVVAIIRRMIA